MRLNCEIIVNSDVDHVRQIYTGFSALHRQGFLKVTQTIPPEFLENHRDPRRWVDYKFFNTTVILDGKTKIVYDVHDWNWIDEEILRDADFYFKRSFDRDYLSTLADKDKVFPLGFNYSVSGSSRDYFRLRRAAFFHGKDRFKHVVKSLKLLESLGLAGEAEQQSNLEAPPAPEMEPKIIFMARAWDTDKIEAKRQKEQVESINETRANCIRTLRKEFGDKFFGGLARDEYSTKNFPDALLPDESLSAKRNYLKLLKGFPICVATTGLNGSNGWKLAEYIALSKAIVTEPLVFEVTGDFAAGRNYFEFTDPATLVAAVRKLVDDADARHSMMIANRDYYKNFLRPDALIKNSLETVLRESRRKE